MSSKLSSKTKYIHALNKITGVGPQKMKVLLAHFHDPELVWKASQKELEKSGIGEKLALRINYDRNGINPEEEWENLERENIRMTTLEDQEYPYLLREIPRAPYIIYTKGKIDIDYSSSIAIVGSRKFTSYGAQASFNFARDLAEAGIAVVSGMAIGIDTYAHRGALEGKGKTVAVLGNSLDDESIYPRNNLSLSREIRENGLLLSEYPPLTSAGPLTFPARNRIVAGLTLGTIVVEAGMESGALITAGMALEYNREVFAVPGPIFSPQSFGTNDLLKRGARPVTSVKDILEELDLVHSWKKIKPEEKIPESKEEETVLHILSPDPLHIDSIAKLTKLRTHEVSSLLAIMEIKGWVKNIGGQNYIII